MAQSAPPPRTIARPGRKAKTFPEKLMDAILSHGDEDVVAWLADGKSFVVVDPNRFVREVLDPVFKHSKYASFVRKLHRWGFIRLTSGTGTDCFHHPHFNRNRREWAGMITAAPTARAAAAAAVRAAGPPPGRPPPPPQPKGPPSLAGVQRFARKPPPPPAEEGGGTGGGASRGDKGSASKDVAEQENPEDDPLASGRAAM